MEGGVVPPVFMTAAWRNLILASYAVEDERLAQYLPPGLALDRWPAGGSAYVSLVAFDFLGTRVFGARWPGHTNFAEINLRFYVRQPTTGRRGVVFIREIVPQHLTALFARLLYNEPYVAAPIASTQVGGSMIAKRYTLRWRGKDQVIAVKAHASTVMPQESTAEHFFKEHEWGFGRSRRGRLLTYRVTHPAWEVHRDCTPELAFDFGTVYGPAWAELTARAPDFCALAVGSEISVYKPES